jgi:hypothetical protein
VEQPRLEANVSQDFIAHELGVDVRTYRNLKNGIAI